MLSSLKLKSWVIKTAAFLVAALVVFLKIFSMGKKSERNKIEAKQKEYELKIHKAVSAAKDRAKKRTRQENEKADNDSDFTGFNR